MSKEVHERLLRIWAAWKKPILVAWLALTLGEYTLRFTFPTTGVRSVLLLIQDTLTGVIIVLLLLEEREKLKPELLPRWVWVLNKAFGWVLIAASSVIAGWLFFTRGGLSLLQGSYLLMVVIIGTLFALQ